MTHDEKIIEAKRLRDSGMYYYKIGEILGYSGSAVYYWLNPKKKVPQAEYTKAMSQEEKIIEARRLRDSGMYYYKIGEILGCNGETVRRWLCPKASEYQAEYQASMHGRCTRALGTSKCEAKKGGHEPCNATIQELNAAFTGKCHLCGKPEGAKWLHMDHCHETGRFRGWLCENCNRSLGLLEDNPALIERGAGYLEGKLNPNIMINPLRSPKIPRKIKNNRNTIMKYRLQNALYNSKHAAKKHGYVACSANIFDIMKGWIGCCYICRSQEQHLVKRLVVDHDHTDGSFRGFLCRACNIALGLANEDPNILHKMIDYLKL